MTKQNALVDTIVKGIQEKKGRRIVVADLTGIDTAPCEYFVICTAGSPQQADAVPDAVEEFTGRDCNEKPTAIAGRQNAFWIAMDYGNVMVHILLPDMREFYDIEHLWDDAKLTEVADID